MLLTGPLGSGKVVFLAQNPFIMTFLFDVGLLDSSYNEQINLECSIISDNIGSADG